MERPWSAKLRTKFRISSKGSKVDHGIRQKAVRKVRAVFKKLALGPLRVRVNQVGDHTTNNKCGVPSRISGQAVTAPGITWMSSCL